MHAPTERRPQPAAAGAGAAQRRPRLPRWRGLPRAIAFLTIAPMPAAARDGLAGATGWFPLLGAAIGALAGSVRVGTEPLLGRGPATVLALITLVAVTGALHQDGLADTADGLGARGDRPGRLAVMRDPSTGVFGALALIGWASLMLTTLASLNAAHASIALTVACALARWAALLHAASARPARSEGLGAALHVSRPALGAATVVAATLTLGLCAVIPGAVSIGTALIVAALTSLLANRSLGGRTGDTLGATIAVTEVVVCVALLAAWRG